MAVRGSKPIGDPGWAPLFLRVALGLYFIALGLWGTADFEACRMAVQAYGKIGGNFGLVYSAVAPIALIVVGAMLLVGLWTVGAAIAAIFCIFPLLHGAGLFHWPENFAAQRTLYCDACVLAGCVALLFTGGGLLSLDHFMKADR